MIGRLTFDFMRVVFRSRARKCLLKGYASLAGIMLLKTGVGQSLPIADFAVDIIFDAVLVAAVAGYSYGIGWSDAHLGIGPAPRVLGCRDVLSESRPSCWCDALAGEEHIHVPVAITELAPPREEPAW